MRKSFLVFGSPLIEQPEVDEVGGSMKSGWLGTGPKVHKFPEWILVQANTTATLVSALACFYRKVRIGNIGVGLRIHKEWTNRLVNFTND